MVKINAGSSGVYVHSGYSENYRDKVWFKVNPLLSLF